jgi:hypothetical protein
MKNYVDGRKKRAIVTIQKHRSNPAATKMRQEVVRSNSKKPVVDFSFYFSLVSPLGEKGAGKPKRRLRRTSPCRVSA